MSITRHASVCHATLALLLLVASSSALALFTPHEIRGGRITNCKIEPDPVEMKKLEDLLLAEKLEPGDYHATALAEVAPDAGKNYIILEVRLDPEHSIGRYDFVLQVQGVRESYPCMAMAIGGKTFDPRLWEIDAADAGVEPVLLLFETAEIIEPTRIVLVPNLGLTIPQDNIELTVQPEGWKPPPPPKPEPKPVVEPIPDEQE
jgi:hypothetical protein